MSGNGLDELDDIVAAATATGSRATSTAARSTKKSACTAHGVSAMLSTRGEIRSAAMTLQRADT